MLTKVVQIGNSRGIRIPSIILKQLRIEKDINLEVIENEAIVIRPVNQNPREGWEDSFKRMHDDGEDELLIGSINDKDSFEWEW